MFERGSLSTTPRGTPSRSNAMALQENDVPDVNERFVIGSGCMLHRLLNRSKFTLAAIDDVIARGQRGDWEELRSAVLETTDLMEKVRQVCMANLASPSSQRYYFWLLYVQERRNA